MWFRRRRRRARFDLSALDRLSELIERIVVLLPEGEAAPNLAAAEVAPVEPASEVPTPPQHRGVLLLVPSPAGYGLVETVRAEPTRGERVELADGVFTVLRLGPSPLPGDSRRCAFLEREEPPGGGRSPDR